MKNYTAIQQLWIDKDYNPNFDEELSLDLNKIEPSVAGPKRPQDKILVKDIPQVFKTIDDAKFNKSDSNVCFYIAKLPQINIIFSTKLLKVMGSLFLW